MDRYKSGTSRVVPDSVCRDRPRTLLVTIDPTKTPPASARAIYYRVSTDERDPESQREGVERYVAARGWRVARV